MTTAHSRIGASTISRLIHCPGSLLASAGVPDLPTTIYAATGTVAHKLAEEVLVFGFDPTTEKGTVLDVDDHTVIVNLDMIRSVQAYTQEVKTRSEGATWAIQEARVCLDPYWDDCPEDRPPISAFGTTDASAYHRERAHLDMIDFKNGSGIYVPADSPQLYYYAAGLLLNIQGPVATIDMTIVQPRIQGDVKPVRTHHTSAVDVLIWVDEVLKPTIAEAFTPGARMAAGKHCRFCPMRVAGCPELEREKSRQAARDFEDGADAHLAPQEFDTDTREEFPW